MLASRDKVLASRDKMLASRDKMLASRDKMLASRDKMLDMELLVYWTSALCPLAFYCIFSLVKIDSTCIHVNF